MVVGLGIHWVVTDLCLHFFQFIWIKAAARPHQGIDPVLKESEVVAIYYT